MPQNEDFTHLKMNIAVFISTAQTEAAVKFRFIGSFGNVGAITDRPVILHRKMTSPKAIRRYFPSGNPKLLRNLGGRSVIAPTGAVFKSPR